MLCYSEGRVTVFVLDCQQKELVRKYITMVTLITKKTRVKDTDRS